MTFTSVLRRLWTCDVSVLFVLTFNSGSVAQISPVFFEIYFISLFLKFVYFYHGSHEVVELWHTVWYWYSLAELAGNFATMLDNSWDCCPWLKCVFEINEDKDVFALMFIKKGVFCVFGPMSDHTYEKKMFVFREWLALSELLHLHFSLPQSERF